MTGAVEQRHQQPRNNGVGISKTSAATAAAAGIGAGGPGRPRGGGPSSAISHSPRPNQAIYTRSVHDSDVGGEAGVQGEGDYIVELVNIFLKPSLGVSPMYFLIAIKRGVGQL